MEAAQPRLMEPSSRSPSSPIDSALFARIAKGDAQAFAQLYDQSSTLLYTLARRVMGTHDAAAGVLEEIYLDIWRKGVRYDPGRGTPTAWLVTLVRSRAIERLRAAGSAKPRDTGPLRDGPVHETPEQTELRQAITRALAELSQAQHQALELAYYHGLTDTQIAAQIGQPQGTVRTRIKLAMNKLQVTLHSSLHPTEAS